MSSDRHYHLKASAKTQRPIVVDFDDGRHLEFPGDLNAELWLDWVAKYSDVEVKSDETGLEQLPPDMAIDMIRMLYGEKLGEYAPVLSASEMGMVSAILFHEYMSVLAAVGRHVQEQNEGDPKA